MEGGETPTIKPAEQEIPIVRDPREFLNRFYESDYYAAGLAQFWEGKTPDAETTEDDKKMAFLGTDKGKYALLNFGEKAVHLKWDSSCYPSEARKAIKNYIESVRDIMNKERVGNQEEIAAYGAIRDACHVKASRELLDEGIAPTEKIGRAISRLVLVDQGLDSFSNARLNDVERIRRMMGLDAEDRKKIAA